MTNKPETLEHDCDYRNLYQHVECIRLNDVLINYSGPVNYVKNISDEIVVAFGVTGGIKHVLFSYDSQLDQRFPVSGISSVKQRCHTRRYIKNIHLNFYSEQNIGLWGGDIYPEWGAGTIRYVRNGEDIIYVNFSDPATIQRLHHAPR